MDPLAVPAQPDDESRVRRRSRTSRTFDDDAEVQAARAAVVAEAEDILWECLEAARDGGADDVTAVALEKSLEETRRLYLAEEADDDGDKFT